MGHGALGRDKGTRVRERLIASFVFHLVPLPPAPLPLSTPQFFNKFFQPPKQLLEKFYISPTIEIAETNVSVHSSHHTPPGLLFGRFLMFINKIRELLCKCTSSHFQAEVFAMVEFSPSSDIIDEGFRHVNSRASYRF